MNYKHTLLYTLAETMTVEGIAFLFHVEVALVVRHTIDAFRVSVSLQPFNHDGHQFLLRKANKSTNPFLNLG
jgi:hypothetical protein